MELSALYQTRILELNRNPLNYGRLDQKTHSARGLDALCGDDLLIEIVLDHNGVIERARWSGAACAITSASASMLTEWLVGRDADAVDLGFDLFQRSLKKGAAPENVVELGEMQMLRAVRDFPSRVNNALLPWRTVRQALKSA